MTDAQKAVLKKKIQEEMEQLAKDIAHLEEVTKPVSPDVAIGRLSRMDNIVNNSVAKAGLNKAKVRLNGLQYALANIDNSEFGYCEECGEPIPVNRLMVMPETTVCVECAE